MTDLENYGPWAVIAGGSEGIGAEFALLLATAGLNLVLLARKPGPLAATAAACRRHGAEDSNGPVYVAGGIDDDVARRNDADRAKMVPGTHRFMQKLTGGR